MERCEDFGSFQRWLSWNHAESSGTISRRLVSLPNEIPLHLHNCLMYDFMHTLQKSHVIQRKNDERQQRKSMFAYQRHYCILFTNHSYIHKTKQNWPLRQVIFLNFFLFTFLTMQNAREKLAGNSKRFGEKLTFINKT